MPGRSPRSPRTCGFALVSAIFLLVALAALGAFAVNVSTTLHIGSALDTLGAQAYYAARAGAAWGGAQTANAGFCTNSSSDVGTVNGVRVSVLCENRGAGDAIEVGLGRIHQITATACTHPTAGSCPGNAGATNYVERQISVLVARE